MLESDSGLRPITPPGLECHHILCSPVNALRVLLCTIGTQHSTQPLQASQDLQLRLPPTVQHNRVRKTRTPTNHHRPTIRSLVCCVYICEVDCNEYSFGERGNSDWQTPTKKKLAEVPGLHWFPP